MHLSMQSILSLIVLYAYSTPLTGVTVAIPVLPIPRTLSNKVVAGRFATHDPNGGLMTVHA